MKILVDADACKVAGQIERIATKENIPVTMYCDTTRIITSKVAEVRYVDKGADAVDFAILKACEPGDVVVTNDGGLASLVLTKKGYAVNSYGRYYTDKDIYKVLNDRYIRSRMKKSRGRQRQFQEKFSHPDFITSLKLMIEWSRNAISARAAV